jgi:hypothetical protein
MAHPVFHFSIGLAVGSVSLISPLADKLRAKQPVAMTMAYRLVGSYMIALYAILPSLMSYVGLPSVFCQGWWMNVFLFSSLIDRWKSGGVLTGTILALLCFAAQYIALLAAIIRTGPSSTGK